MAAHAAMLPPEDYLDRRSAWHNPHDHVPVPRELDTYMRDDASYGHHDTYMSGSPWSEDHDVYREQHGHRRRDMSTYDERPAYRAHEADRIPEQRRRNDPRYAPAPDFRNRDQNRRANPEYESAPVYRERDDYRRGSHDSDISVVYRRSRDDDWRNARGPSNFCEPSSFSNDGDPAPDRRAAPPGHDSRAPSASTRIDASRHPSPTQTRSGRTWPPPPPPGPPPPPEKRQGRRPPRRGDFHADIGNPNGIPIAKREVDAIEDRPLLIRGRANNPPPGASGNESTQRRTRVSDIEDTSLGRNVKGVAIDRVRQTQPSRSNEVSLPSPLPLNDIPPNIHPSRIAAMSQESSKGSGGRQAANMRAPRKQLEPVAQSIEPSIPAFAKSSNAIPLGQGKKMRF